VRKVLSLDESTGSERMQPDEDIPGVAEVELPFDYENPEDIGLFLLRISFLVRNYPGARKIGVKHIFPALEKANAQGRDIRASSVLREIAAELVAARQQDRVARRALATEGRHALDQKP
jgi:hypothetical protein